MTEIVLCFFNSNINVDSRIKTKSNVEMHHQSVLLTVLRLLLMPSFYTHFMGPSLIYMGQFSTVTLNLGSGEVVLYNQMSTSFGCAVNQVLPVCIDSRIASFR